MFQESLVDGKACGPNVDHLLGILGMDLAGLADELVYCPSLPAVSIPSNKSLDKALTTNISLTKPGLLLQSCGQLQSSLLYYFNCGPLNMVEFGLHPPEKFPPWGVLYF